jgi:hypothetical protein
MIQLDALIESLRNTDTDAIVPTSLRLLTAGSGWKRAINDRLSRADPAALYFDTARLRVPNVQPTAIPLHIEANSFLLVVNHYNRAIFEQQRAAGTITPHTHHFSFASRVVFGSLYHVLFDNYGTLDKPKLQLARANWLRPDDVFRLDYPDYHLVLEPEEDTVTFMIRGTEQFQNPYLGDPSFTRKVFDATLARVRAACRYVTNPPA